MKTKAKDKYVLELLGQSAPADPAPQKPLENPAVPAFDELTRQVNKLLSALERRAEMAETLAANLQSQIDELRRKLDERDESENDEDDEDDEPEDTALVAAIQRLEESLAARLDKVARVAAADRIMIEDELGTARSRVVL